MSGTNGWGVVPHGVPDHGNGLRCGLLVGVDINLEDTDQARRAEELVEAHLGKALVRVGRWPRRLLVYRTNTPFGMIIGRDVEVLGEGQQFVAFGLHQKTGKPYVWIGDSPLEVDWGARGRRGHGSRPSIYD